MNMFKPRKVLSPLMRFADKREIIVIHGARQTGKTTLLKLITERLIKDKNIPAQDIFYFDLEDFELLEMFNKGHKEVVSYIESRAGKVRKAKIYLLIDEVQYLSAPSSLLKILHDHYEWLKVIVSGSSSFQLKSKFGDSLVGRTVDFELYPLDFEEFILFKGQSFNLNNSKTFKSSLAHKELARLFREYLIYGGYPKVVLEKSAEAKTIYLKQVIDTYIKKDIRDLGRIRDVFRFNKLLRVLADKAGALLNVLELSSTVGISRKTIEDYLFIMENTYVIKLVAPFFTNVRGEISKMPKIFFEDTGVANLLKYGFFLQKLEGELFENAMFCIIRSIIGREFIRYWRTKQKTEIDFIVDFSSKKIPLEAKLTYPRKSPGNLASFLDKYRGKVGYVVSLEGAGPYGKDKRVKHLYPWEIYYAFKKGDGSIFARPGSIRNRNQGTL